jgi:hypothetical protein
MQTKARLGNLMRFPYSGRPTGRMARWKDWSRGRCSVTAAAQNESPTDEGIEKLKGDWNLPKE